MPIPPPIQIPGFTDVGNWIVFGVGLFGALYWLRALRLAREGARRFLRNALKSFVVFLASDTALSALFRFDNSRAQGLSVFIGLFAFAVWHSKKRSRYIPAAERRAVIARHLEGGKYDPQLYHIDHIWPHSKGGSNTRDNLRVIEKKRNLQKGARRPRMRDMF